MDKCSLRTVDNIGKDVALMELYRVASLSSYQN